MIDLSGKVASVTGAAGGIRAEMARTLAKVGAKVVLGDVQAERSAQSVSQVRNTSEQTVFTERYALTEVQWVRFIDTALDFFGDLGLQRPRLLGRSPPMHDAALTAMRAGAPASVDAQIKKMTAFTRH